MQQEVREGAVLESRVRSGRGEEERESDSGGHHEDHEGNHVLDYFNDNAEEDTSALEEREDLEGLHTLEQAKQSEEHSLGAILRGRLNSQGYPEVGEGEEEAEDVEVVPEVREVGSTSLIHGFDDLDG